MKIFLAITLTLAALLLDPLADQAFGDSPIRPDLSLAPLALIISLCPGGVAVLGCGLVGLILDCLAGPQLGARVACFCLLAALASMTLGRGEESVPRRVVSWTVILFAAEFLSRIIQFASLGGVLHPSAAVLESARSAGATTVFLTCLWLAGQIVWRGPRRSASTRRFALAIGRAADGN
jgi:cell shape-determining protein MreD